MVEVGLRERKKASTRTLIVDVADQFFVARGYDDVTLDEVAARCEVSVRTVLRYFESKEALALSHERTGFERFKAGLAKRRGDVLGFWRYHIGTEVAEIGARAEWSRQRYSMIHNSPTLYLALIGIRFEYRDELAAALENDVYEGDRLTPIFLASTLTCGQDLLLMSDWLNGRRPFDPDALLEVVDYASDLFASRLRPRTDVARPSRRARRVRSAG
jgi:AcrR family transcriptional regulator